MTHLTLRDRNTFLNHFIFLSLFLMSGYSTLWGQTESSLLIVSTGDLRGEIKPCGCSPDGDMGGLLRRATYLEKMRKSDPSMLYFDLGNNFPTPTEQGYLKVKLIQESLKKLKPLVILLGPNELLYDQTLLDKNLPYLISNIQTENNQFKPFHLQEIDGKKLGIWGYLSPTQIYQNKNKKQNIYPVSQPTLQRWKQQLNQNSTDYSILLFRGNEKELAEFEQAKLFDLIITGNNNDDELNQILEMSTSTATFHSVPTKGQGALQAHVNFKKNNIEYKTEWFLDKYSDHPKVKPLFQHYDDKVKELFFTNLDRMDKHKEESPYIGAQTCQACHGGQHQIWSQSQHAHAFETLKKVNKHFDLECLQCHVVGLNQGGFLSPELTPNLPNVQCENCHGPAKAHITNPQKIHPGSVLLGGVSSPIFTAQQACASCHKGSHSPKFDFKKYWPKIKH